jgi:hypothetical protein
MAYATIVLELFKSGMHVTCEEAEIDEFVPAEDGNKLMDIIDDIDDICNPDARFVITEEGKAFLEKLKAHDNGI